MSRSARVWAIVVVAAFVLGAGYFIWLKSSDTSKYYEYATYVDLRRDPKAAAANVPGFVPSSARHIWGWYDVDFNVSALEFEFDGADHSALTRPFQRMDGGRQTAIERKVRAYKWKHEMPRDAKLETFSGHQEGTEYLVLDTKNWRAYYVSEPRG